MKKSKRYASVATKVEKNKAYSTAIYNTYLEFVSKEDVYVYSIDEVFIDVTHYLSTYKMRAKELATKVIQDVYETTGITATLETNYTISAGSTYEQLPLVEHATIGSALSLTNNAIEIGAGVSYVKVSFHAQYDTVKTAGNKWATLYLNNEAIIRTNFYLSNRGTISSAEVLLPVTEGDTLSLYVNGAKGDVVRNSLFTALTAEAVG